MLPQLKDEPTWFLEQHWLKSHLLVLPMELALVEEAQLSPEYIIIINTEERMNEVIRIQLPLLLMLLMLKKLQQWKLRL